MPLPPPPCCLPSQGSETQTAPHRRIRFALQTLMKRIGFESRDVTDGWAWVGPYSPRHQPSAAACWQGSAVSEPVAVTLRPRRLISAAAESFAGDASTCVKPRPPAPLPRAPLHRPPMPSRALLPLRDARDPKAPRRPPHARQRGRKTCAKPRACAGKAVLAKGLDVSGLIEGAVDDAAAAGALKEPPGSRGSAGASSMLSSAQVASDLDHVAPSSASSATTRIPTAKCAPVSTCSGTKQTTTLPRLAAAGECQGPEHGSRWRCLGRQQDPLANPLLLELAEAIVSIRSGPSLVALCTERLKTRTGRRFVDAIRALGARVMPMPDVRALAEWAEAPRALGAVGNGLVLIADWWVLGNCCSIVCEAREDRVLADSLLGTIALCEPREESAATDAAALLGLACPCRVLPSLAFV